MKKEFNKLKLKVLGITTLIIMLIAGLRLYDDVISYNKYLNGKKDILNNYFISHFVYEKERIQNYLITRANAIISFKQIREALNVKDRDLLYKLVLKRFETIKNEDPNVKRMHFYEKGTKSFLRLHKPEVYGDILKDIKPIIANADNTKMVQYGFAFGLHDIDNITYRIVMPVYHESRYIGLLEFGYDFKPIIDNINMNISKTYSKEKFTTSAILIQKDAIPKDAIKQELVEYYKEYALNYDMPLAKSVLSKIGKKEDNEIALNNKYYWVHFNNDLILTYDNRSIVTLMSIYDITEDIVVFKKDITLAIIKPIIVLVVLIFLFNWLFNYFIKSLESQNRRRDLLLNTQPNMVIITNGERLQEANQTFFDFFNYENIDKFLVEHECVCSFFEQDEEYDYLKKTDGTEKWADIVINNQNSIHKALMRDKNGNRHIFDVKGKKLVNSSKHEEVIVFTDITELEKQREHGSQKDKMLFHQSKMAAMGEMLNNIAHQWRQPLSVISTSASGMKLQKEFGQLTDDNFKSSVDTIVKNTQWLSRTIDDFRNFFKKDNVKNIFNVKESFESLFDILGANFDTKNIELVINIADVKTYGIENEFIQAMMNIINNAKDALEDQEADEKYIFIDVKEDEKYIYIEIKDNAGGIPADIKEKIFEPYFTTKHQTHGTGIGLYMTEEIIVKHMNGNIEVDNIEFGYNNKEYIGAIFRIALPKNKEDHV